MREHTAMRDHELLTIGRERLNARPSNLGLSRDSVAFRTHAPVVMIHRDSDALSRSNFTVILRDLEEHHGDDETDGVPDVTVERFRDWAYGWTEHVLVRVERPTRWAELDAPTDAWRSAVEWLEALESYPVADEEAWSALELEELTEYVASELRGEEYLEDVLERLLDAGHSSAEDLPWSALEDAYRDTFEHYAVPLLEQGRAYLSLRSVGDGQLTLDGETVRVPAPPALDELELLLEDRLPWAITRVVEDTDTYGQLLELRDVLAGSMAAA